MPDSNSNDTTRSYIRLEYYTQVECFQVSQVDDTGRISGVPLASDIEFEGQAEYELLPVKIRLPIPNIIRAKSSIVG
jgi:hypothetical protein